MNRIIRTERDREEFIRVIREVALNKPYFGSFKVHRKARSLAQNRYYWAILRCVRTETGNDIADLHDYFKEKYLGWYTREIFSAEVKKLPSTAGLNSKQFTEYIDSIRMEMLQQQGISIPCPGEYGWEEFVLKYASEE